MSQTPKNAVPVRIVRASAEYAGRIAPLFDAYRQFYQQPSDLKAARQFIAERLIHTESVIFLALLGTDADEPAVGFTQLYPSFSSTAMKRLWILNDLYVAPDARRHGVAKALMERARQFAVDTKADGLCLETAVDNLPGQRLYESLGWERDNEFFRYNLRLK
jgi:ribosomal protein S18 acetylase RimI-like enzyme